MKLVEELKHSFKGLVNAVARYPFTTAFLVAIAVVNFRVIQYSLVHWAMNQKFLLTFAMGAALCMVAQVLHERFFMTSKQRLLLIGGACMLTLGYFLMIYGASAISMAITVRTTALLSALFMAFIWLPSAKAKITFNEIFMAVFKTFFIAVFFSGVIFFGVSIIISAINLLLFRISYLAYQHAANIIYVFFAPLYFLSLVPNFNKEQEGEIQSAVSCPKFLDILISNIIIPLASVYTVILVLYIVMNITGGFWTDNLIEPLLVSYSIVVIVIYILAGKLNNKLASAFKRIFPKVLIPVVMFQTLASVLKIGEVGLTHSRYYVIMYGLFAIVAGFIFSFFKASKNGIVAIVLITLSIISAVPPVDAFTVSKMSQIATLERALERNGILVNSQIVPKENIPDQDMKIISNTALYISRMGYAQDIAWLADDFNYYVNFESTFGFSPHELNAIERPQYIRYFRNKMDVVDISGYEFMVIVYFRGTESEPYEVEAQLRGETYFIGWQTTGRGGVIYLRDSSGSEIISLDFEDMLRRLDNSQNVQREISSEEASFTVANDRALMKVVVNHIEIYQDLQERHEQHGEVYVLVNIK